MPFPFDNEQTVGILSVGKQYTQGIDIDGSQKGGSGGPIGPSDGEGDDENNGGSGGGGSATGLGDTGNTGNSGSNTGTGSPNSGNYGTRHGSGNTGNRGTGSNKFDRDAFINSLLNAIREPQDNTRREPPIPGSFGHALALIIIKNNKKHKNGESISDVEMAAILTAVVSYGTSTPSIANWGLFMDILNAFSGSFQRTGLSDVIVKKLDEIKNLLNEIDEALEVIELCNEYLNQPYGDQNERNEIRKVLDETMKRVMELVAIINIEWAALESLYQIWINSKTSRRLK